MKSSDLSDRRSHNAESARTTIVLSTIVAGNDAEGLAQLARTGWYREVCVKSAEAHVIRGYLLARQQIAKARRDFENQIRALLQTFGLKVGAVARSRFEA